MRCARGPPRWRSWLLACWVGKAVGVLHRASRFLGSPVAPTVRLYQEPVPASLPPQSQLRQPLRLVKPEGFLWGRWSAAWPSVLREGKSVQPGSSPLAWASARLGVRRGGKSEALLPPLLCGHSQAFCSAAVLKSGRRTPEPSQSCVCSGTVHLCEGRRPGASHTAILAMSFGGVAPNDEKNTALWPLDGLK